MMFSDVALSHPAARVRHIEQQIDGWAGWHEHRVLPDEVRFDDAPSAPVARSISFQRVLAGVVI